MDYQRILDTIAQDIGPLLHSGRPASYIPMLANVPVTQFGMAIHTVAGKTFTVGHADQRFSIQSISKLFACVLALRLSGPDLWRRVGCEPSGTAFNSLVQLEYEHGIPRNPFVNAGALVLTDLLCSHSIKAETTVVQLLRRLSGNALIDYDNQVAQSEWEHAHRNMAIAHLMKSYGNLANDVATVVTAYCRQCAIEMSCVDLAKAASFLANEGVVPWTGEAVLDKSATRRLNSLMLTCGTYDAVGDIAFRVGLPAKSGVGGGIVAVLPGSMGICAWSPGIDASGNSPAAVQALEWLRGRTDRSIF